MESVEENSNTTLVKVKSDAFPKLPSSFIIQIQLLLKLNNFLDLKNGGKVEIQIQLLLKLNFIIIFIHN